MPTSHMDLLKHSRQIDINMADPNDPSTQLMGVNEGDFESFKNGSVVMDRTASSPDFKSQLEQVDGAADLASLGAYDNFAKENLNNLRVAKRMAYENQFDDRPVKTSDASVRKIGVPALSPPAHFTDEHKAAIEAHQARDDGDAAAAEAAASLDKLMASKAKGKAEKPVETAPMPPANPPVWKPNV